MQSITQTHKTHHGLLRDQLASELQAPSSQLAIGGSNANNPNTTGADIPYNSLTFQSLSSGNNFNVGRISAIQENGNYLDAGAMAFSTGVAGLYERMRITTGGNVGIGTTTPMGKLDVNFSNVEPKNAFVFSSASNPTYSPAGGLRFAWYGTNFADIQMVRQGNSNDGLGLSFHTSTSNNSTTIERMRITAGGNVIIGNTTQTNASYILDVWGNMRAKQITVNTTGADFVFEPSYKLNTLPALKEYIDQHHHLPEIASAAEMQKDGLNLGDNQVKLLQKVEELTLYLIEKDKKDQEQQTQIDLQKQQLEINKQQLAIALLQLKVQEEQMKKLASTVSALVGIKAKQ